MSKKIIRKFDVKSKYICVNERTKFKIGRIKRNFFPGARFYSMTPGPPWLSIRPCLQLHKALQSASLQCNNCTFYTTHFDFTIAQIVINCPIKYALMINGKNTNTLVVL